jgi:hypothetical protein
MSVGTKDLILALGQARATFVAHVGPGATTTSIPLADLNLGAQNLGGNIVLLAAGALGAGTPPTLATISSNTATTLTVPALAKAPAAGAAVWVYVLATIQADIAENIAQVGGANVPAPGSAYAGPLLPVGGNDGTNARALATDGSGRAKVVNDQAQGAAGAAAPAQAVQVAGTDGTDLRALATDAAGRLTPQPVGLVWDAAGLAVAAATNVFGSSYQPPTAGLLSILICNNTGGASAVASIVKTANTAPSGGSPGTRVTALNAGNAITVGANFEAQIVVTPNDSYNLQFSAGTNVDVTATFDPR